MIIKWGEILEIIANFYEIFKNDIFCLKYNN